MNVLYLPFMSHLPKFRLRLLFLVFSVCLPVFSLPPGTIGTVDLITLTALHPSLALFDFSFGGFLKIPLGLSLEERKKAIAGFRSRQPAIESELAPRLQKWLADQIALEKRRTTLANGPVPATSPDQIHVREQLLASYARQLQNLEQQITEARFQSQFPEFTTPEETAHRLADIQEEIAKVIGEVAETRHCQVVLNTSLPLSPNPFPKDQLGQPRPMSEFWLECDLFYAFLGKPASGTYSGKLRNAFLQSWLNKTRAPEVWSNLALRPYPLVISGGLDLTEPVLEILHSRHGTGSEAISLLIAAVRDWRRWPGNFRK